MIKEIKIANFLPFYGEHTLSLDSDIISIEARYLTDPLKSNRAGKSAIVDAIRFCLYGKTRKVGQLIQCCNKQADIKKDPCGVAIILDIPHMGDVQISRYYDVMHGGFVLHCPELGTDLKQAELQTAIEQMLGCDYDTACRTWLVLQEESAGLMAESLANRKSYLTSLLLPDMSPWALYSNTATEQYSTLNTRAGFVNSSISKIKQVLDTISVDDLKLSIHDLKKKIVAQDAQTQIYKDQLQDLMLRANKQKLTELLEHLERLKKTRATLTSELQTLRLESSKLQSQQKRFSELTGRNNKVTGALLRAYEKFDEATYKDIQTKLDEVLSKIAGSSSRIQTILQDMQRVEKFSGLCPVTRQECPSGQSIHDLQIAYEKALEEEERIDERLQEEKNKLYNKVQTLKEQADEIQVMERERATVQAQLEMVESCSDRIESMSATINTKEITLEGLNIEIASTSKQAEVLRNETDQKHQIKLAQCKRDIQASESKKRGFEEEIAKFQGKLAYVEEKEKDFDAFAKESEELKGKIEVYKILKTALSKDGLPFHLLITSVAELEVRINEALLKLGTAIQVFIEPYRTLTTKDPTCDVCGYEYTSGISLCPFCKTKRKNKRKETLDIQIQGKAYNVNFDEDSGGGRLLVALAIRLALWSIYKDRGMMQGIDFMVMDEVCSPLDVSARQQMLRFFYDLKESYDLSQLYIISHTDISDTILPCITVVRDDQKEVSFIEQ
jgi:DNA repair exonuclease SbcCD ATPase subunit